MTRANARFIARALILLTVLGVVVAALPGCTMVRYTSPERSLTIIDLHPTKNAISLSGVLNNTGTLDVNREQGSAEGIVSSAINAASGGVLSEVLP